MWCGHLDPCLIVYRERAVQVEILQADKQVYVACIDDKLLMKIGIGTYQAESNWREEDSGKRWKVWLKWWNESVCQFYQHWEPYKGMQGQFHHRVDLLLVFEFVWLMLLHSIGEFLSILSLNLFNINPDQSQRDGFDTWNWS